jgi:hypothetical protein
MRVTVILELAANGGAVDQSERSKLPTARRRRAGMSEDRRRSSLHSDGAATNDAPRRASHFEPILAKRRTRCSIHRGLRRPSRGAHFEILARAAHQHRRSGGEPGHVRLREHAASVRS